MTEIRFICPGCQHQLEGDNLLVGQEVECSSCSKVFTATFPAKSRSIPKLTVTQEKKHVDDNTDAQLIVSKVTGQVTRIAGIGKLEGFRIKEFFSEAFRKHTKDEVEEYFTVGTPSTTPDISKVDTSWPRPWVFFRTFFSTIAVYFLFVQALKMFPNVNLVPGLIMVGSFAVPVSTLVFFMEINARRNVSLYQVLRLVFAGGIFSLIFSLTLYQMGSALQLDWLGASVAGIVEEPGKLLALLLVVNIPKYRYTLNGLLFGAAIGTGFASFESAGYALTAGMSAPGFDAAVIAMTDTIMERGMLSPFAHIAWTGMCGAALWKVKGERKFSIGMVGDIRFLRIFAIAVAMHMLWNSPLLLTRLTYYGKFIGIGVVAWIIILALIQDGLKQLRAEKNASSKGEEASVPTTP